MKRIMTAMLASLALAGCSAGTTGEVKLGVDVAPLSAALTSSTSADGSSDLVLSRVRVLVAHAKVGYTGGQQSSDGPAAEKGPYVIELTADEIKNGAHRDFSLGSLPTGTYGGAEIEIQPLDDSADTSDASLADFVSSGASVLVEGTYQGNAFSFAGHFLAEQGTDGDVTIDAATPVSLAMTVDTSAWFTDSEGALVDPSDTAQHDAIAVAICETLDTEPQASGASLAEDAPEA